MGSCAMYTGAVEVPAAAGQLAAPGRQYIVLFRGGRGDAGRDGGACRSGRIRRLSASWGASGWQSRAGSLAGCDGVQQAVTVCVECGTGVRRCGSGPWRARAGAAAGQSARALLHLISACR